MNVYEANDTMRLISQQDSGIFTEEILNGISDISEARPRTFKMKAAMDLFLFETVHGAAAERTKLQSRLASKELWDICSPEMLEDIKDLVGDNVPRNFMQLAINIYTVAYIRGKQDVIKIITEEGTV